jgi:RNA-binding protein
MLNSKQRSYLKAQANALTGTIFIGKEGITDNLIKQLESELAANELVKGKVLESGLMNAREAAQRLSEKTCSEVVHIIGGKFVLYKKSKDKTKFILP